MTDYIKQIESKVKDCNNTNTIFDTRKYVLLEDVKEVLNQALNIPVVVGQSEQLRFLIDKFQTPKGNYLIELLMAEKERKDKKP